MVGRFKILIEIFKNMGLEYVYYRGTYEVKRKFGLLKNNYPTNIKSIDFDLNDWKQSNINFLFKSKNELKVTKVKNEDLENEYFNLEKGILKFFSVNDIDVGIGYDWVTNPTNEYKYDIEKHWTEIEDITADAGDIKYVWEKSRFSFLYNYIRYDYHFGKDCSVQTLHSIKDWINKNPLNKGPNYKCSQEISLRVLNWLFALNYYKDSKTLNQELFKKIMNSINGQIDHVFKNIKFSRKTVRNNHAISETLTLYIVGLLLPQLPNAHKWKTKGKKWFEEEVLYQIYEDGTHLLFSTNYHRAVLQLFSWALYLSELNNEKFKKGVYVKIKRSVEFLYHLINEKSGDVPNIGPNDGSLFYKLNNRDYRDYRPQLNVLYYFFNKKDLYNDASIVEEAKWFSSNLDLNVVDPLAFRKDSFLEFKDGGYYVIKDHDTLTLIKNSDFKDRPSHADNLHLDIWFQENNILRDAGTYMYNTSEELIKYFNGTKSHNTVTLGDYDQMLKGPRFIWMKWPKLISSIIEEQVQKYKFTGKINSFRYLDNDIVHKRTVEKVKGQNHWIINDIVQHETQNEIKQWWNVSPYFFVNFDIEAFDENDNRIEKNYEEGWYSGYFGVKEKTKTIVFKTGTKQIKTIIKKK